MAAADERDPAEHVKTVWAARAKQTNSWHIAWKAQTRYPRSGMRVYKADNLWAEVVDPDVKTRLEMGTGFSEPWSNDVTFGQFICCYDGSTECTFFPATEKSKSPIVSYAKRKKVTAGRRMDTMPISLLYKPFSSEGGFKPEDLKTLRKNEVLSGKMCHVMAIDDDDDDHENIRIWVTADRDCLPVKWVSLHPALDVPLTEIETRFLENAAGHWVPAAWKIQLLSASGDPRGSTVAFVRSATVNVKIDDEFFQHPNIPPEARIIGDPLD